MALKLLPGGKNWAKLQVNLEFSIQNLGELQVLFMGSYCPILSKYVL